MTKYSFVGFPVQQEGLVDIPDDALVVGANFTIQNQWQIMCLVPVPETAEQPPAAPTTEQADEEAEKNADVPPES